MRSAQKYVRRFASRATLVVLALAYVMLVAGVSIPVSTPKSAERFPCENCPCGCATAEFCWKNCCCHSAEERLAWAKENGVTPPKFVKLQAELDKSHERSLAVLPPCCRAAAAERSCCSNTGSEGACCEQKSDSHQQAERTDRIVGWRALKCQGQSLLWLAAVPSVIEPKTQVVTYRPGLSQRLGPPTSITGDGISQRPPVPPPRHS